MYINGTWYTICQTNVKQSVAATVLCQELGFQTGVSVISYIHNEVTEIPSFPGFIDCEPDIENLSSCTVSTSFAQCDHSNDLSLNCWNDNLANGELSQFSFCNNKVFHFVDRYTASLV